MPSTSVRPRRPWRRTALATAGALLAVLIPAGSASAYTISVHLESGAEKVGSTATYSFECNLESSTAPGAQWFLESYTDSISQGTVSSFTTNTPTYRAGSFTVDYAGLEPGGYRLFVQCENNPGSWWSSIHSVNLVGDVVTTTNVSVADPTLIGADFSDLHATVSGGVPAGGLVDFSLNGSHAGTASVDAQGHAQLRQWVPATSTVTAAYRGDEGFLASSSGSAQVTVVTDLSAPESVAVTGPVVVGSTLGTSSAPWSPDVAAGTVLSYVWTVDGDVVGTGPHYAPVVADLGKTLEVTITGTHPRLEGISRSVTSAPAVVGTGTLAAGTVEITGHDGYRAVLGQQLTAATTGWPAHAALSYVWTVGGRTVSTAPTYTPVAADLGHSVHVEVTGSAAGYEPTTWSDAIAGATATPTVTVAPVRVTAGQDAVVRVDVAGPAGGPVPTGEVTVTATPTAGGNAVDLGTVVLDEGVATVTMPRPGVGTYDVAVGYGGSVMLLKGLAARAALTGPYTPATGVGTIEVARATPIATVPDVTVPVATPAVLDVEVTGTALPQSYVVRDGATALAEGLVPEGGALAITLPVLAPGVHRLTIELPGTEVTTPMSVEVTVTVVGEPARATGVPTAQLESPKAASQPGQSMDLVARGFLPGETVAFYLHSDPVFLGTAVAGADGVARLTAAVPDGVPLGAHTVVATGGESGRWASLPVELARPTAAPVAAGASASAAALPTTGVETGALLGVVWLLVLTGAVAVVIGRRLRAQA
ncbi:Ig-like domain repeat protein [Actinotalea ferrariae]|uniref:hypothetical protein n=1 Tax=Actinotalea ferrariae TaxID=1386098 RepID=UPI001C8B9647|nr:hypothetical protein [Actinotalea ferrariae]MBX9246292.1 Ig-like domain repeat protein [Actinotalea ferrariae]